jgi:hypothetical protein
MAKVAPWHSIRHHNPNVFHDNTECLKGMLVAPEYRKAGHRCRARCRACIKLDTPLHRVERTALLTPH